MDKKKTNRDIYLYHRIASARVQRKLSRIYSPQLLVNYINNDRVFLRRAQCSNYTLSFSKNFPFFLCFVQLHHNIFKYINDCGYIHFYTRYTLAQLVFRHAVVAALWPQTVSQCQHPINYLSAYFPETSGSQFEVNDLPA